MDSQLDGKIVIAPNDVVFECPSCNKSMVIDQSATGMVVECLQCRTNVIVPRKGWDAVAESLLLAAQQGDLSTLNDVLAQGADVNATTPDGTTVLMLAVQQGNEDCV